MPQRIQALLFDPKPWNLIPEVPFITLTLQRDSEGKGWEVSEVKEYLPKGGLLQVRVMDLNDPTLGDRLEESWRKMEKVVALAEEGTLEKRTGWT